MTQQTSLAIPDPAPDEAANDIEFDSVPAPLALSKMLDRFDPRGRKFHPWWGRYLASHAWKLKRALVWDLQQGKCGCIAKKWIEPQNRHTHHRTYDRVGFEEIDDLIGLCSDCHAKLHGKAA